MNNSMHIFGYGSLMNEASAKKTGALDIVARGVHVKNYCRIFNAPGENCAYLNIKSSRGSIVEGVVVAVPQCDILALKEREWGYDMVDISSEINGFDGQVYTFIAPQSALARYGIRLSYIMTCLYGIDMYKWNDWIRESVIFTFVIDDMMHVYDFLGSHDKESIDAIRDHLIQNKINIKRDDKHLTKKS